MPWSGHSWCTQYFQQRHSNDWFFFTERFAKMRKFSCMQQLHIFCLFSWLTVQLKNSYQCLFGAWPVIYTCIVILDRLANSFSNLCDVWYGFFIVNKFSLMSPFNFRRIFGLSETNTENVTILKVSNKSQTLKRNDNYFHWHIMQGK